MLEYQR
jgi:hypothetical protein